MSIQSEINRIAGAKSDIADAIEDMGGTLSPGASIDDLAAGVRSIPQGAGVSDYDDLTNRPQINSVTLTGNKSLSEIGAASQSDLEDLADITGDGQLFGFTATDLTGAANELKNTLNQVVSPNAGSHNSIYRGKNLGSSVTAAQYAEIDAGTFNDLFIGDYWVIGGVNYRIAAFDYWLNTGDGDRCQTHHVVIVPDSSLASGKMNDSDVTTGAYIGSDFYTGANNNTARATAQSTVKNAFGSAHILSHREYLMNAVTNGYESGQSICDVEIELMDELMVYGSNILHNIQNGTNIPSNYTMSKSQLPLFQHRHDLIGNGGGWWLRDVVSSAYFAYVSNNGSARSYDAFAFYDIRPAFAIKA